MTEPRTNGKRTISLGDGLYLVEGAARWALYDLYQPSLARLDKATGNFLAKLSAVEAPADEKRAFLSLHAPSIWRYCQQMNITDRLFEPDRSRENTSTPGLFLWLEITDACNECCVHCYAESGPRRTTFMPLALARRVLNEAYALGFRRVQFTGGEIFLHRDLWPTVEHARALGFEDIELYTNLTLVRQEDLERIRNLGLYLATTLLGPNAEIHDACTRSPGSFRRWLRNMRQVKRMGISYRIGVIRMRPNEHAMESIRQFLIQEGFITPDDAFLPDDVRPTGRGRDDALIPSQSLSNELYLTVSPEFFHLARRANTCWWGELAVAPDGSVYPCVFARSLLLGNVHEQPLAEIVSKARNSYWNITLDQVEQCRDCEFRYACIDCRTLSLGYGLGLYGPPPRCPYDPHDAAADIVIQISA